MYNLLCCIFLMVSGCIAPSALERIVLDTRLTYGLHKVEYFFKFPMQRKKKWFKNIGVLFPGLFPRLFSVLTNVTPKFAISLERYIISKNKNLFGVKICMETR